MKKTRKKLVAACMVFSIAFNQTIITQLNLPTRNTKVYAKEVSDNLSNNAFNEDEYVIVVSENDFFDMLISIPLAKKYNAPILFMDNENLGINSEEELKKLKSKNAIIVGGTGVISKETQNKLNVLTKNTERIAGKDRYQTSAMVANKIGQSLENFIVNGENKEDIMSTVSIAAAKGAPILYAESSVLQEDVKKYLDNNIVDKTYIVGGIEALNNAVERSLNNSVERIYGQDKYETNYKMINRFKNDVNMEKIHVTNSENKNLMTFVSEASNNFSPIILLSDYKKTDDLKSLLGPNCELVVNEKDLLKKEQIIKNFKGDSSSFASGKELNEKDKIDSNIKIDKINTELKGKHIIGDVYINANGVNLTNMIVDGTVYINVGNDGHVVLDGLQAKKIKVISARKEKGVQLKNTNTEELVVENSNSSSFIEISTENNTKIKKTIIKANVNLNSLSGSFGEISIKNAGPVSKSVKFDGKFEDNIIVQGSALLKVEKGCKLDNVDFKGNNATIKLEGNFENVNVESAKKVEILSNTNVNIKVGKNNADTVVDISKGSKVTLSNNHIKLIGEGAKKAQIISNEKETKVPEVKNDKDEKEDNKTSDENANKNDKQDVAKLKVIIRTVNIENGTPVGLKLFNSKTGKLIYIDQDKIVGNILEIQTEVDNDAEYIGAIRIGENLYNINNFKVKTYGVNEMFSLTLTKDNLVLNKEE